MLAQQTNYTCGPTAMSYALHEQGIEMSEQELAKAMGTTPQMGTDQAEMVSFVENLGLDYCQHDSYDSLEALERRKKDGYSIILDYLAGPNLETDGHYVVFEGLTADRIKVLDPSDGKYKSLSRAKFIRRWVDQTFDGQVSKNWALVIRRIK
jgi:ABC-type bacteriocin/lantibiotic exporter with double-glycine peptidase domain